MEADIKAGVAVQLIEKAERKAAEVRESAAARRRAEDAAAAAVAAEHADKVARFHKAAAFASDLDKLVADKASQKARPDVTPLEATFAARFLAETRAKLAQGIVPKM
jgi:hypothetical protein